MRTTTITGLALMLASVTLFAPSASAMPFDKNMMEAAAAVSVVEQTQAYYYNYYRKRRIYPWNKPLQPVGVIHGRIPVYANHPKHTLNSARSTKYDVPSRRPQTWSYPVRQVQPRSHFAPR